MTDNLTVDVGSSISADGMGYGSNSGPLGAGSVGSLFQKLGVKREDYND